MVRKRLEGCASTQREQGCLVTMLDYFAYCAHCGEMFYSTLGHINRAKKLGAPLYCGRKCAGLGRRKNRTEEELKRLKREYDREYRAKNLDLLKRKKHEHFKRTYDPKKEAVKRRLRMPRHVEYCRRPEYRKWKRDYDIKYRAKTEFGPFFEAALVLRDIEQEVDKRMDWYDRATAKGTLNKALKRRREYDRINRF